MHVRPSDFSDLSTVEALKVLRDECSTLHVDKSLWAKCGTLLGQQKDQSKDIGLRVCVRACVIASVWNNV